MLAARSVVGTIVGSCCAVFALAVCDAESAKASPKAKQAPWKADTFCALNEDSRQRNIQVRTILTGKETVVSCPAGSEGQCSVGSVGAPLYYLSLFCRSNSYTGDWSPWECEVTMLNLAQIERREVGMWTAQSVKTSVKAFDIEAGETRIGPLYGGVDLVVSGMKPSTDRRYAFGGSPDVLGMGGALVKSRIEMRGACQAPPKD